MEGKLYVLLARTSSVLILKLYLEDHQLLYTSHVIEGDFDEVREMAVLHSCFFLKFQDEPLMLGNLEDKRLLLCEMRNYESLYLYPFQNQVYLIWYDHIAGCLCCTPMKQALKTSEWEDRLSPLILIKYSTLQTPEEVTVRGDLILSTLGSLMHAARLVA